jgi:hypothetical protein
MNTEADEATNPNNATAEAKSNGLNMAASSVAVAGSWLLAAE